MNTEPKTYTEEEKKAAEEAFLACHEGIRSREQAMKVANVAALLLASAMPSLVEAMDDDFRQTSRKFMADLEEYCVMAEKSEFNNTRGVFEYARSIIDLIREDVEDDKEE